MRRLLLVACAAAAVSAFGAGSAGAFHGGHEYLASGRGETDASTDQTTTQQQCVTFFGCVTYVTRVQQTVRERFSFSARQGDPELGQLPEPHGSMTVDYALSRTVSFSVQDPGGLCGIFFFCPPPSTTTTSQAATASANVTCLTVVNNRAVIGGRVTKFEGDFVPTRGLVFNATDNTIAGQQVAPDGFAATFAPEAPQACPAPSADRPITSGDVTVEQH